VNPTAAQVSLADRPPISFLRRLAAWVYDGLVLCAVAMLGTAPLLFLTEGEAVPAGAWWFRLYLLGLAGLFFCWFWIHGGQTLGMRAWRVKLICANGAPITWRVAIIRFAAACLSVASLGLGFAWAAIARDKLTWHDRLSGTRPVLLSRDELNA